MPGDTARVVDSTMFVSNVAQSTPQASAPPPNNIAPLSPKTDQFSATNSTQKSGHSRKGGQA